MMRTTLWLLIGLLASHVTTAQTAKKQITIEDLYKKGTFSAKGVPGFKAMKDGKHYTQLDREGNNIYIRVYSLDSGRQVRTLFDSKKQKYGGKELNVEDYAFSNDEQKILLFTEGEHIYRHSALYRVYMFDLSSGGIIHVDNDKILHATFSPDGQQVAFVKNNNLFCSNVLKETIIRVTTDGEKNKIINGNCDWVYEEEFGFTQAYQWSKDGHYLAYYRFDESKVPEYTLPKYTGLYPEQYTYKYPKAGERNSVVQIKIFDLQNRSTVTADAGTETDQYIPRIKWTEDPEKLCIYRLNRLQNDLALLQVNAKDGKSAPIYTETNKSYINIDDDIAFLPDGHSMILRSERDGYSHLFHWDWEKQKITVLTEGLYDVDALTGIDLKRKVVYYTSAEASPMQRKLYVVDWKGKGKKVLTPENGMHVITPCEGYNYFLDRYTQLNKVPVYYLRNTKGEIVRTLEDNKALESKMNEYALGNVKFLKVAGVSDSLNAWMITPPDFNANKKYPVLMFQYSGPGSQQVLDKMPTYFFWHQMLAEKGYIILCTDGTGTGFRGEAFRKKTYLQLGKYESDDQIAVAKGLASLPYVDKDRIGIWGWSYGGFMSATCLMKGNDVFKAAISVAPVTNWRYYDNIYTERYMRTPKENASGYDDNSPEKMVSKLKGKLLLVHGTADDNVHFQNSVMLVDEMIKAGKEFDSEYYPDKAHGISGGNTSYHLFSRMTDFILKNL
jgi:dipeptidyl-peptidase-4